MHSHATETDEKSVLLETAQKAPTMREDKEEAEDDKDEATIEDEDVVMNEDLNEDEDIIILGPTAAKENKPLQKPKRSGANDSATANHAKAATTSANKQDGHQQPHRGQGAGKKGKKPQREQHAKDGAGNHNNGRGSGKGNHGQGGSNNNGNHGQGGSSDGNGNNGRKDRDDERKKNEGEDDLAESIALANEIADRPKAAAKTYKKVFDAMRSSDKPTNLYKWRGDHMGDPSKPRLLSNFKVMFIGRQDTDKPALAAWRIHPRGKQTFYSCVLLTKGWVLPYEPATQNAKNQLATIKATMCVTVEAISVHDARSGTQKIRVYAIKNVTKPPTEAVVEQDRVGVQRP